MSWKPSRLFLKSQSQARERAIFRLARTAKQSILNISAMQPDADQAKNKPLEARATVQTEPLIKYIVITVVALLSWVVFQHHLSPAQEDMGAEPNTILTHAQTPMTSPMIIWYHSTQGYSLESLQLALSSGLVSHVMVSHQHRLDAPLDQTDEVKAAIEWIHAAGKKVIWTRTLWPYHPTEIVQPATLFDPNYYINEIQILRQEAQALNADSIALDTEPYGQSVMRASLKSDEPWDTSLQVHLSGVIQQVVHQADKVDFILPGGSLRDDHPYNILARLGTYRISENTYYAHDKTIKAIRYPYEIFGVYLKTDRHDPKQTNLTFYQVPDVFDQSQRWSTRRGVLLYTDKVQAEAVAHDLHRYIATLQRRAAADRRALSEELDKR